ncbi:segregation/condensation protein A [Thermosyntropha sp.]|uniref:segregation and condensation protein A n=1 Tax=Thermosyntropha sp. TaxID=2740820 RepID=UPI0025FF14A4|nr:segregation/condensation protein A [Thermosyntropha sp.]MBO8159949.1 segregation/condensation protein A [Thermosyntropha sp.]
MNYVVDLEVFHGPLDLLLYLIEKNKIDIYDIPIAQISDQYMEYLQKAEKIDLDKLGDFLVMASYLLNLKSRMLLPVSSSCEDEEMEEEIDPRLDLVQSLLDYRKFKKAAGLLMKRQEGDFKRVFFREYGFDFPIIEELTADKENLFNAYKSVLKRISKSENDYEVPDGDVNVAEKMDEILCKLYKSSRNLIFQELFAEVSSKREALALFLALLELIRTEQVTAVQETVNGPIKIFLRVADKDDAERSD